MRKDLTELVVILDESGSMGSVRNDTIGGFNTFLETHQKLPGEAKLTLVKFNTHNGIPYNGADVKDVKPLDHTSYFPGGGTALFDAVGKSIDLVSKRINNSVDEEVPEKVIFCVLTDGEENSSNEYTKEAIKDRIENMKKNFNWEFLFIGADQDAWAAGGSININQNVNITQAGTKKAFKGLSHFTSTTRSANSNYATLYNVAGVGLSNDVQAFSGSQGTAGVSNATGQAYTFADSFAMTEDQLDLELAKFATVADAVKKEKKTKVKKSKA